MADFVSKISDVMAMFALVSQALRTGEPMHQVLPQCLLDRLFYHHNLAGGASDVYTFDIKDIRSLDYMYYATGLVAVYQLLQVISYFITLSMRLTRLL